MKTLQQIVNSARIDPGEFFALSSVKAQIAIQKRNPWGSKKHREAHDEICRIAELEGVGEYFQKEDY